MCMWLCCAFFLAKYGTVFYIDSGGTVFYIENGGRKNHWAVQVKSVAFFATMVVRSDSCIHVIQMLPFIPPHPPNPCQSIRHKLHQEAVNIRINLFCDKLLVLFLRKHIMKYFILFFKCPFKRYPV